ncbi:hypothetical protein ACI3LY_001362 [Candidozyma auris]|uniref:Major facilitator superfamily (MFS) profile domain-containing protein n=2 Tax=Candidozyma auris TaxID=498019 RepID=A0A2H0ZIB7_CANAR|nr:hypothetical protein QG37_04177 [[Candida] auris]PIS50368.1 hypothetical protein B9J08_004183 [[Candida] auris]QWW25421.1 hypothetical protein CA7LBN_004308 [[Candida] auris]
MGRSETVETQDSVLELDTGLFDGNDFGETYIRKALVLNHALDKIGFGRYQVGLFIVAGFGWFQDNAWPSVTAYILPRLIEVDGVHYPEGRSPYLLLSQSFGLLAGAVFWSFSADIIGRRWAFNITFLIIGIFGICSGASPNFAAAGCFCALWSFGVGGNLPVDSAIMLEALPTNKKWLLTVMSVWWAIGQVVCALISWGLISNYSCSDSSNCLAKDNRGWRYFVYTLGGLTLVMFLARFLTPVYESPTFHMGRGNDAKAVEIIHKIAHINRTVSALTVEDLQIVDDDVQLEREVGAQNKGNQLLRNRIKKYNLSRIRQCFGSRRLALSSSLVILSWGLIGLAFPLYTAFLPTYLEQRGSANKQLSVGETYRNTLIVAVVGIPGAIIAGIMVELRTGRKGVLFLSLILTGVVLFGSTTAKTPDSYLAWNCFFSFFSNIMYGTLYAYTPEIFPTKIRGTAVGLAASANRVFSVFSPIIAIFADLTTPAPIYTSGALFLVSAFLVLLYPYEPHGKHSL